MIPHIGFATSCDVACVLEGSFPNTDVFCQSEDPASMSQSVHLIRALPYLKEFMHLDSRILECLKVYIVITSITEQSLTMILASMSTS